MLGDGESFLGRGRGLLGAAGNLLHRAAEFFGGRRGLGDAACEFFARCCNAFFDLLIATTHTDRSRRLSAGFWRDWPSVGTAPGRRGAPRVARPDVFMRDLGPVLAELAATALARIGLSEIGEVCDGDRPRSIRAEELFCSPRSVPFGFLRIEVLTCVCPPRHTARCRATYALSARRYRWLETFSRIETIEHIVLVPTRVSRAGVILRHLT